MQPAVRPSTRRELATELAALTLGVAVCWQLKTIWGITAAVVAVSWWTHRHI